jgi:4-amino-4-deoxy-L-arabinose transferase-like glycosyltransferase
MQPQSEISILDWLREKLRNPRELLREWQASRKPAQATSVPDETVSDLPADGQDFAPGVSPPARPAERLQTVKVEAVETATSEDDVAQVAINAEIPHGTTLTITIRADSQGQVSVEKQAKDGQPAWRKIQAQPGKQIKIGESIHALKVSLAKAGGFLVRLMAPVARLPILRNGLVFILLGLVAAFLADSQVREAKAFTETALLPLMWAGVLFAWGTWAIHHREASLLKDAPAVGIFGFLAERRERNIALGLIGAALMLTFWVTQDSVGGGTVNAAWLLNRWVFAILLVCVAAWLVQEKTNPEQKTIDNKWLLPGVAVIILLAFGLRIWQLGSIPFTLGGDEGEQGVEILRVLGGQLTNPFITGWYGVPTLSFFFNAPSVALFGNTMFGIRLTWVLVGTASVLTTYLLVKELKGTRLALISAALVATYHYHLHYSRLGSNQISDTLLVSLGLLFLVRGYLRGKWLDWALAGVVVGIGQYFYAGGRLAIVLALFLLAYLWVRDGFKITRINRIGAGIFLIALLVAGGPMFGYAVNFPDQYHTRTNQIGILQNGWLVNEAIILEKSQGEVLLDQFWRASLAFNAYPDRTAWYGLEGPLLDQFPGILFIVGILSATLWSIRDRRLAPMVAWWWAAILTGGMLTDTTPSSQRLITTAVPTMFFVAWAIEHFVVAIRQQILKPVGLAVGILATLILSISSINLYFNDYTPRHIFGGEHAMIGTIISQHVLDDLGEDTQIYFFGAPRMYINIGTVRYLIPDTNKVDLHDRLEGPFAPEEEIPENSTLLFIFLPERLDELEWVRQTYPEGQWADVAATNSPDKVLYSTYTVKNSFLP